MTPDEAVVWYDAAEKEAYAIFHGKRGEDESGPLRALQCLEGPRETWSPSTEPVGRKPKYLTAPRANREARAKVLLGFARAPTEDSGFSERTILAYEFAAALLLAVD